MAVKTYGGRRFREVIDHCLDLTDYAARLFQNSPRLAILTRPQLGIFAFRYVPENIPKGESDIENFLNRLNQNLVARIISSREVMLSSTRLGSRFALRFCVLNHRTRKEDVRQALRLIEQLGREAEASIA